MCLLLLLFGSTCFYFQKTVLKMIIFSIVFCFFFRCYGFEKFQSMVVRWCFAEYKSHVFLLLLSTFVNVLLIVWSVQMWFLSRSLFFFLVLNVQLLLHVISCYLFSNVILSSITNVNIIHTITHTHGNIILRIHITYIIIFYRLHTQSYELNKFIITLS